MAPVMVEDVVVSPWKVEEVEVEIRGQLAMVVREDAVLGQGRVPPARLQRRKHVRTAQRAQPAQE